MPDEVKHLSVHDAACRADDTTMRSAVRILLRSRDTIADPGQRLGEWVGHGPVLEEDIALTNVALDLLGQARLWFAYAGEVEARCGHGPQRGRARVSPRWRRVPQPAAGRAAERRLRRHDGAPVLLRSPGTRCCLHALARSTDARIAEIAAKACKEVAYHVERSADWVIRLGDGTEESHARMQAAVDALWMYTGEMFVPDAIELALMDEGVAPAVLVAAAPAFRPRRRGGVLAQATLANACASPFAQKGGHFGRHNTEALGPLLAEMQFLPRSYPDARW